MEGNAMINTVASLTKGGNVALPEGVSGVRVGLSWEAPHSGFDLDAWTLMLNDANQVPSDEHFVFFNNPISPCGSVAVSDDNQEGGSDGDEDDETVTVDLSAVPASIVKIMFIVNIYEARKRSQTFGELDNAAIRLYDTKGNELARYNLGEGDVTVEASLVFGELYRHNGGWKFRAIAQGKASGSAELVREYGVEVDDDPEPETELAPVVAQAPQAPAINLQKGTIKLDKDGVEANIARTKAMEFSLYWTKPNKDLGLIIQIARNDGTTEYLDWRRLRDNCGAVVHHGDRVHGGADIREHATVKLDLDPTITAIAVMAYSEVGNGAGSFKSMGTHAVIDDGEGTVVTVDLKKGGAFSYHTVIAVITVNSDGLKVERASRFSASGSERRPEIDQNGRISMNTGPVVFK